eukprot:scaffold15364_cov186-Alexandrium_tamarense.AAC.3
MSLFPNTNLVSSNDDDKENITPNRRKAAASSAPSPVEKCLNKTAADPKLIRQAKTLFNDMAASDSIIATVEAIFTDIDNNHGMIEAMRTTIMQQLEEAGVEGKARKDLLMDDIRFNDGMTFAFDVLDNYSTKLDSIRRTLKL